MKMKHEATKYQRILCKVWFNSTILGKVLSIYLGYKITHPNRTHYFKKTVLRHWLEKVTGIRKLTANTEESSWRTSILFCALKNKVVSPSSPPQAVWLQKRWINYSNAKMLLIVICKWLYSAMETSSQFLKEILCCNLEKQGTLILSDRRNVEE